MVTTAAEIQVYSRLDIGHKDFFGDQLVNCRHFPSHHNLRMDFVFFIQLPPFYEGIRAEIECAGLEASLGSCWYGRVVLLFSIRVKADQKDRDGRSVLKACDCSMIDCLYDYVGSGGEVTQSFNIKFVHLVISYTLHKHSYMQAVMRTRTPEIWSKPMACKPIPAYLFPGPESRPVKTVCTPEVGTHIAVIRKNLSISCSHISL